MGCPHVRGDDIFMAQDEIYLVFAKKNRFLLYSPVIQKAQPNFFPGRFPFDLAFSVCLLVFFV